MNDRPAPRPTRARPAGRRLARLRLRLPMVVIGIALLASIGYILWVVREVQDQQITLVAYGFIALGLCFAAIALGSLVGLWRAASRAQGGRSFGLAIVGGLAGLAAIGSFSVAALLLLVVNS